MRLFLQDGPARLQIVSRQHLREFRDVASAREFLRPFLAQAGNASAVRHALGEGGVHDSSGEAGLLDRLAQHVVAQQLLITSCADSYLAAIHGTFTEAAGGGANPSATAAEERPTPLDDEQAAATSRADEPGPEEEHWIEVALLGDDGNPIAGARYSVDLPDGTTRSGTTDASGRARINDIDPGTAKVSFPELDQESYKPEGGG